MRFLLFFICTSLLASPFSIKQGELPAKSPTESFTLFSLNTLCLPYPLSYFTDGMPPWPSRINGLIAKIQELNPDVICLQEVYSNLAAKKLIERLKPSYAVFYYDIDPKWIGLNSGLFVASKFSIQNANYKPFKKNQFGVSRGAFLFETSFAAFVNTHLEANKSRNGALQNTQLSQLAKQLHQDTFVVGDLNIAWGTPSYNLSILPTAFFDPYNQNRVYCTPSDATCSEVFNKWSTPTGPEYVIYDYVLFYGKSAPAMHTTLVPFYSLHNKAPPLSDHQGLLTQITLP